MTGAVLWDLDGTLVDSEDYHWRAWQETMAAEGRPITHEEFLRTFGWRNDEILPQWFPNLTAERSQRIALAKEAQYRRLIRTEGLDPLPGVADWLHRLHAEGWRQAIASSAPRLNVEVVLEVTGLAACFETLVSGEDVTAGKPDPQVFLLAASRLGAAPRQCIVVEDAAAGLEAARRAGMRNIAVSRKNPQLKADLVVATLADLPPNAFDRLAAAARSPKI